MYEKDKNIQIKKNFAVVQIKLDKIYVGKSKIVQRKKEVHDILEKMSFGKGKREIFNKIRWLWKLRIT